LLFFFSSGRQTRRQGCLRSSILQLLLPRFLCVTRRQRCPAGLLQPLTIPSGKWEDISMDFIVGLPKTAKGYDSIWVVVDRFTKSTHFIPVKTGYKSHQYAELYIARIVSLHDIPKTIISDRGSQFVARFWEQLHAALGT